MIKEIGVRGEAITHLHTLENFRTNWMPEIMDRSAFIDFDNNRSKDMYQLAHQKYEKLMSGDDFWKIEKEKAWAIDEVINRAEKILV